MWSFSIHPKNYVLNASFFSFHEFRNCFKENELFFLTKYWEGNKHYSSTSLKIVGIHLFRRGFLLCSLVLMGPLWSALWQVLCQLQWYHLALSCYANGAYSSSLGTLKDFSESDWFSSVFHFQNIFSVFPTGNILSWIVETF